jgi:6-pyruvoyltetrahydropterin/6-carboxytetrahydropterin synthase
LYTLSLQRRFTAWHHLVGGDWGAENQPHTHSYKLELELRGAQLDQHGYLVDLVEVEQILGSLTQRYADADLNELAEFKGLNPSLENFCRLAAQAFAARLAGRGLKDLTVRIWENEEAWASYQMDL